MSTELENIFMQQNSQANPEFYQHSQSNHKRVPAAEKHSLDVFLHTQAHFDSLQICTASCLRASLTHLSIPIWLIDS